MSYISNPALYSVLDERAGELDTISLFFLDQTDSILLRVNSFDENKARYCKETLTLEFALHHASRRPSVPANEASRTTGPCPRNACPVSWSRSRAGAVHLQASSLEHHYSSCTPSCIITTQSEVWNTSPLLDSAVRHHAQGEHEAQLLPRAKASILSPFRADYSSTVGLPP